MRQASLRAAGLAALLLVLAGCTSPSGPGITITHVHGLAFDPTSNSLFIATHHGLAKGVHGNGTWEWSYVGEERNDLMGFSQDMARPGVFYSSGHPADPHSFGGVNLGLRRSTDGGVTWEQRSLKGQADFHALTTLAGGDGRIAGGWQGQVMISTDGGLTWANHPAPPADLIALAGSQGAIWAGTTGGLYRSPDGGQTWSRVGAPSLTGVASSVGASPDGSTLLAGTGDGQSGKVMRSTDGGATWQGVSYPSLADAPGQVLFAFDASKAGHAFAAMVDGTTLETLDSGASWAKVR